MHARIQEVLAYFDAQHATLDRAVASVPPALRERRPSPERWSIAEVLEHVALIEGQITWLLATRLDAARAAGLGPEEETTPIRPTLDLSRALDRSRRIEAGESSRPNAGIDLTSAEAALSNAREALRATVLAADGLALTQVSGVNPVLGPLNAYQWVLFAGAHEARHAEQVQETGRALEAVVDNDMTGPA
jgi:hypothetical protein